MSDVIVYSTKSCPYCKMVTEYLKSKNIEFEYVDVGVDMERAMEMIKKSGQQGVPVLDIKGKIVVGFNKPEIDKYLGL
jgi:glutaredoxin-like YruB-family protein